MAKPWGPSWLECARIRFQRTARASLAGAILLTTHEAQAFRTAEELPELSGTGPVAWPIVNPSFHLNARGIPTSVDPSALEISLTSALQEWASPECTQLAPTWVGWLDGEASINDGSNSIQWVDGWSERGLSADSPGYADVQYHLADGRWSIAEVDIYLNATDFDWGVQSSKKPAADLAAVLTHELGHAFGVLHPCEFDGSAGAPLCGEGGALEAGTTMYPLSSPSQVTIADDDSKAVCYLYPRCPACDVDEQCIEGECRSVCEGQVCETGLVCGYWGCILPGTCSEYDCIGRSCAADADCGPLASCRTGVCARGSAGLDDGCDENSQCADGACLDGRCSATCLDDLGCPAGSVCELSANPPAKACSRPQHRDFGSPCAVGEDCATGLCLITNGTGICSIACDSDLECDSASHCIDVDERRACIPYRRWSEDGCSVSSGAGSSSGASWLVISGILATWSLRRKRTSWKQEKA